MRQELSGWGRYPRVYCAVEAPRSEGELAALMDGTSQIARGKGRAYGDAALQPKRTISMLNLNRFISFDPEGGLMVAEAGVTSEEIIDTFLPRGWFLPVTPGTKFVTLGGMIAADVHGKNHHGAGSFGAHVAWIDVMDETGEVHRAQAGSPLFDQTVGGMGLTGVILRAALRLKPVETGWIRQETIIAQDLDAAMAALEAGESAEYSVAWIDTLATGRDFGRSLIYLGEHARVEELPRWNRENALTPPRRGLKTIPIDAPDWVLNRLSAKAFNALYYRAGKRKAGHGLIDWDTYFYPLDAVGGWNRLYGRRGFSQYQCAFPLAASRAGLGEILETLAAAKVGAFLSVLKLFGPGTGKGISFPIEGYTLTMDFPMSAASHALMDRLDGIVARYDGRLYLAKDSRQSPDLMRQGYDGQLSAFSQARPRGFASLLSERLGI
ncbi:MAG: FAD-binding oxidoreductase [Pseudomonadota bacterium]